MNPQVLAAYQAVAADAAKAKEAALADNARAQVVVKSRMRLAQSEEFAEIKYDVERDIADNNVLLQNTREVFEMYRAQGAIWALQTLLDRYESADAALKHLEAETMEATPE